MKALLLTDEQHARITELLRSEDELAVEGNAYLDQPYYDALNTTPVELGGFDGVVLTFGDDTDDGTLNTLFGGWTLRFDLADGTKQDLASPVFSHVANVPVVEGFAYGADGEPNKDDRRALTLGEVVGIHIY